MARLENDFIPRRQTSVYIFNCSMFGVPHLTWPCLAGAAPSQDSASFLSQQSCVDRTWLPLLRILNVTGVNTQCLSSLPHKVVRPRDLDLTPELGLGRQLVVLQDLVDRHLVALAVGVDLSRHLVREQVELAPGELDVGEREDAWTRELREIRRCCY